MKDAIKKLQNEGFVYPNARILDLGEDTLEAVSVIRFERDGKWYLTMLRMKRTCIGQNLKHLLLKSFMKEAYIIQHLFRLTDKFEILDKDQTSEKDRLIKLNTL